jgi:hypothetical protein
MVITGNIPDIIPVFINEKYTGITEIQNTGGNLERKLKNFIPKLGFCCFLTLGILILILFCTATLKQGVI